MNQDQQTRRWWKGAKDNWIAWVLAVLTLAGLLIATILGYLLNWEWTGLVGIPENPETRTAWDWLGLLIIPLVIALATLWFNTQTRKSEQELARRERENEQELARRERENDRQIAEDRVREEALQRYLNIMQELIIDKGLRKSEEDTEIRDVARVRTLTVLRSLDGNRKGQVVRFLHEADLIGKVVRENSGKTRAIEAIIHLGDADLGDTNLNGANLTGANLSDADLRNADLEDANLSGAYMSGASLVNADLSHAYLIRANLSGACLVADLSHAYLNGANLSGADLRFANLNDTDLRGAYMRGAWLEHPTDHPLARVKSLVGATLPDGMKMTEEAWEEFKKFYLVGATLPDGTVMTWEEFKKRYGR
jgi:uncharacterized protein YjbI with pentapeptide repeats